jgi:hypothetical protein
VDPLNAVQEKCLDFYLDGKLHAETERLRKKNALHQHSILVPVSSTFFIRLLLVGRFCGVGEAIPAL